MKRAFLYLVLVPLPITICPFLAVVRVCLIDFLSESVMFEVARQIHFSPYFSTVLNMDCINILHTK